MRKGSPIKNVDEQGRVLIPSQIRERIDLRPGDPVEISDIGDDTILVRRAIERCITCDKPLEGDNYVKIDTANKLCPTCSRAALQILEKEVR